MKADTGYETLDDLKTKVNSFWEHSNLLQKKKNHTFPSCIQIYFLIHNAILFPRLNYLFLFRHTLFKSSAGRERNRGEPEKQILSEMQKCMPNRRPTCHIELYTISSVFETLKSHSLLQRSCSGSELECCSRNIHIIWIVHDPNKDLAYTLLFRIQKQKIIHIALFRDSVLWNAKHKKGKLAQAKKPTCIHVIRISVGTSRVLVESGTDHPKAY